MSDLTRPFVAAKLEETRSLLDAAIFHQAPISIWSSGDPDATTGVLDRFSEASDQVLLSVQKKDGLRILIDRLQKRQTTDCLFQYRLPTDIVFFRGNFKREDRDHFVFRIQAPLYLVQRREKFRLPIAQDRPQNIQLKLEGVNETVSAQIMNLSEGGCGLAIETGADFEKFSVGKIIERFWIQIQRLEMKGQGVVRFVKNASKDPTRPLYRVGIQFMQMDSSTNMNHVSQWITEESLRFRGRF